MVERKGNNEVVAHHGPSMGVEPVVAMPKADPKVLELIRQRTHSASSYRNVDNAKPSENFNAGRCVK